MNETPPVNKFHPASWAIRGTTYSGTTLNVLVALAVRCNADGHCWSSNHGLQEDTRASQRAIQYALKVLSQDNWIRIRRGRGPGGCNAYRLNLELLESSFEKAEAQRKVRRRLQKAGSTAPELPVEKPVDSTRKTCETTAEDEVLRVQILRPKGAAIAPRSIPEESRFKTKAKACYYGDGFSSRDARIRPP